MSDAVQRYELHCQACCSRMLTCCCLHRTDGKVRAELSNMLESKGLKRGGYGSWLALQRNLLKRFSVEDGQLLHNAKRVVAQEHWADMVLSTYSELVKDAPVTAVQLASQICAQLAPVICVDSRQHGLGLAEIAAIISAQPDVFVVAGEGVGIDSSDTQSAKQRAPAISQHETECHFFVEAPANSVVMLHVSGAGQVCRSRRCFRSTDPLVAHAGSAGVQLTADAFMSHSATLQGAGVQVYSAIARLPRLVHITYGFSFTGVLLSGCILLSSISHRWALPETGGEPASVAALEAASPSMEGDNQALPAAGTHDHGRACTCVRGTWAGVGEAYKRFRLGFGFCRASTMGPQHTRMPSFISFCGGPFWSPFRHVFRWASEGVLSETCQINMHSISLKSAGWVG
jgi:hypothetical protein